MLTIIEVENGRRNVTKRTQHVSTVQSRAYTVYGNLVRIFGCSPNMIMAAIRLANLSDGTRDPQPYLHMVSLNCTPNGSPREPDIKPVYCQKHPQIHVNCTHLRSLAPVRVLILNNDTLSTLVIPQLSLLVVLLCSTSLGQNFSHSLSVRPHIVA